MALPDSQVDSRDLLRWPLDKTLAYLQTSIDGQGSQEAKERLREFGRNELAKSKRVSSLVRFFRLIANPLILILLIAGAISGLVGEVVNASIIFVIVLLSIVLLLYQETKAHNASEKLRSKVAITSTALRDGVKMEIPLAEVVPGDIVYLSAGDMVPADARVLEGRELFVNQSALTGESFPVEKSSELNDEDWKNKAIAEYSNSVLFGTSVVSGYGMAVVFRTGGNTEFGKISSKLAGREPETEFERSLRRFGFLIMEITLFLVLFVFFVNALLNHGVLESLLFAVALAVGLTPELLPMIMTVNLSKGALAMSKKGVIVKKLASIQNLGSMDVLCTDKTGTLTENKIQVAAKLDSSGNECEKVLSFTYLNSFFHTGLKNPLDDAVLKSSLEIDARNYKKIDEIPFDFTRKRMSVVVEPLKTESDKGKRLLITKGAPENILDVSTSIEINNLVSSLTEETRASADGTFHRLSSEGLRVLGLSYKEVPSDDRMVYQVGDECEMTFLGFIAFIDPPKKQAKKSLELLRKSQIELKVLTGDNELVARKVCEELGFKISNCVLGSEIEGTREDALSKLVEKTNLFARVTPIQKDRILEALRHNGHVVGFLGDGINDAPSMRAADVGISVDNAVDVAKESADIILSRKSLIVLHDGVAEGRKTFGNTMKYVMMGLSSNFGNMFSMAGASLILPFLPMLPTQILLNNLLYDISESTIPTDNVDEEYLRRPKRLDVSYIRSFMVLFGLISSLFDFLTFFLLIVVLKAPASLFQTAWFIESFSTQTLVIFVIRTRVVPFYKSRPSRFLLSSTLALVAFAITLPLTPIGALFGFVEPPAVFFAILAVYIVVYLLLVEMAKIWFYRKFMPRVERIGLSYPK